MNRDELLQALRHLAPETGSLACLGCGHEHKCSTHGCAVIRAAAREIETLTSHEPNTPLTLEELRGMCGEPVWLESKSIKDSYWVIFNGFCDKVACFVCAAPRLIDDYGKGWLTYRRKPEEER